MDEFNNAGVQSGWIISLVPQAQGDQKIKNIIGEQKRKNSNIVGKKKNGCKYIKPARNKDQNGKRLIAEKSSRILQT